jgi:hypothetical protein
MLAAAFGGREGYTRHELLLGFLLFNAVGQRPCAPLHVAEGCVLQPVSARVR